MPGPLTEEQKLHVQYIAERLVRELHAGDPVPKGRTCDEFSCGEYKCGIMFSCESSFGCHGKYTDE